MKLLCALLGLMASVVVALDLQDLESNSGAKKPKVLSLFSIVTFKNAPCRSLSSSSSGARNGTCYTSSECAGKNGFASGSCAAGFGVCCVFFVTASGASVIQNCTYIRNPGFPSAYSDTNGVSYTIRKCSSAVCFLRLDFESFVIAGPSLTTEVDGPPCVDSFTVTASSGQLVPQICGLNTGQHMYISMGNADSDTATLNYAFTGANANRMWEIKVTQIECYSPSRPLGGCLQYFTTLSGRMTTFNFASTNTNHLPRQDYSMCVRQESGYCCVSYTACTNEMNAFSLSPDDMMKAKLDTDCTQDFIEIAGSSDTCQSKVNLHTRYCGPVLNTDFKNMGLPNIPICDCTQPFEVLIHTDSKSDVMNNMANAMASRGVCLDFQQVPCQ